MATKKLVIDGLGEVRLYKRRGARSLRLSVSPKGYIRVTMPVWAPYKSGLNFAKQRSEWIKQQLDTQGTELILDGARVGKSHYVTFKSAGSGVKSLVKGGQVIISSPFAAEDERTQAKARLATELALKKESEKLFPQQLDYLATKHGFSYSQLKIRKMSSRWGSCSSKKTITLSTYLVQLPWELIDYVMVHELLHTRHMHHGAQFWADFEAIIPNARKLRKEVNRYKPRLVIS